MNEAVVRELVREAIARHLVAPAAGARQAAGRSADTHASHALYVLANPSEACLIEPDVPCSHCGFCKSHGH